MPLSAMRFARGCAARASRAIATRVMVPTLLFTLLASTPPARAVAQVTTTTAPPRIFIPFTDMAGGNAVAATVTIATAAPASGRVVTLTSSSLTLAGFQGRVGTVASMQLTVPHGATSANVTIKTFGVATTSSVRLTASDSAGTGELVLTLQPAKVSSVTFTPTFVTGGATATGSVDLDGEAPAGVGTTATIVRAATRASATGADSLISVPTTVAFRPLARRATFTVSSRPTATLQVYAFQASVPGQATPAPTLAGPSIVVTPPEVASLDLAQGTVVGGNPASATVVLTGVAPPGGTSISIATNAAGVVPMTGSVAAGSDRAALTLTTREVSADADVVVSASVPRTNVESLLNQQLPGSRTLRLVPLRAAQVSVSPSTVLSRDLVQGTVLLNGRAPSARTLTITRDGVSLPSVSITPGSDRVTFSDRPGDVAGVQTVTLGAAVSGTGPSTDGTSNTLLIGESPPPQATARLTVHPIPSVSAMAASPSPVTGGDSVTFIVSIANSFAPTSGPALTTTVSLATDRADLVRLPPSLPLALGQSTIVFKAATAVPPSDASATVRATTPTGNAARSLTVQKPRLAMESISARPATVTGGGSTFVTVTPSTTHATTATVTITSDNPGIVSHPGTVTLAPSRTASFTLTTTAVATPTTVIVTATVGTERKQLKLLVNP